MKKINIVYFIGLIVATLISCNQSDFDLNGTRWYLDIKGDCGSHYYFKNGSVIIYNCEIPENIYGTYKINSDSIEIQTLRGEYDDEFSIGSKHRHKPSRFNLLIENDTIISNSNNQKFIRR